MNNEEINNILELSKNDKNLHHKKGHGGLLFITLSMIQFSKLKRYIKQLQRENKELKEQINEYKRLGFKHLQDRNRKLEHNWNKLREYIGEEWYCFDNESVEYKVSCGILDKMKELERGVSDE